jgi:hypothetical protein
MKITEQQALVLFDIGKEAMKQKGGFAGYSNEEIMRLLNDIIGQQDNVENIVVNADTTVNDTVNDAVNDADYYDDYEKTRIYSDPASDASKNDDFWSMFISSKNSSNI